MLDKIKCTKTDLGKSDITTGNKFRVTLTYNNKTIWFVMHDNCLNKANKRDFLKLLFSTASAYHCSNTLEQFMEYYRYTDIPQAKKYYKECKKQYDRVCKLFHSVEVAILERELAIYGVS
jgi:hypothetical protein